MSFPAADAPRLTAALAPVAADAGCEEADYSAALAYIAGAEGSAAAMAERACDRCGLDFAACPPEILEAAERRAEELTEAGRIEVGEWVGTATATASVKLDTVPVGYAKIDGATWSIHALIGGQYMPVAFNVGDRVAALAAVRRFAADNAENFHDMWEAAAQFAAACGARQRAKSEVGRTKASKAADSASARRGAAVARILGWRP